MSFVSPLFTKVKNMQIKRYYTFDSLHIISMILKEFLMET